MRSSLILSFLFLTTSAHAASFNCDRATQNVEKIICSDPAISKQDDDLSKIYESVKSESSNWQVLRDDQIKWIKQRNKCATSECVKNEYEIRMDIIETWIENEKRIAKENEGCTDRPECWPEGSSMHMGLLLVQKLKQEDEKLTKIHEQLVNLVISTKTDERLVAALRSQQNEWLKYRSQECELIGSLKGGGGTWPSTNANRCEVNLTEERIRRVNSSRQCIERTAEKDREFEIYNCLQQLAPLANKV